VTAAMADGTGLKQFALQHPGRFFDVGIAEEHAVTFAAGLAEGGLVPVVAMYSTFLQRAYDQVLEDVCLQNLHVIFAIDRAGIVGQDGETHQGVFDVSFLTEMPNLTVIAPKNALELKSALHHAIHDLNGPVAIRYGRGAASCAFENHNQTMKEHRSELLIDGSDATIFAVGAMNEVAGQICEELKTGYGVSCGLVNVRYLKPLDTKTLLKYAEKGPIITLEDNQKIGGFGQQAAACLQEHGVSTKTLILAVGDQFVTHGKPDVLMHALGLSKDTAVEKIASFLGINRI
ncbi:MAG: transketolase C-terminal domain-containing protein, partial [Lachnospiraceae bacterium]|nr:transketolase C-terminal domain-containing protein [Lachnospiraceae bacterium]